MNPMPALCAATALLLASCTNVQAKTEEALVQIQRLQTAMTEQEQALRDVAIAAANPEVTEQELALAVSNVERKVETVRTEVQNTKGAVRDIADAAKADLAAAAKTWSGLTAEGESGLIGIGITALAWILRDRRKKLGKDPVQAGQAELEERVSKQLAELQTQHTLLSGRVEGMSSAPPR